MHAAQLFSPVILAGTLLLGNTARAAPEPLWILLSAPDLRQPLERLATQRMAEKFRVVTLDSSLAADGPKAVAAITSTAAGVDGPVYVVLAGTADESGPAGFRLPAGGWSST